MLARGRGRWFWIGAMAIGLGALLYSRPWRPLRYGRATPPVIDLHGAEVALVRAIESARADVTAQPYSAEAWGRLAGVLDVHDLHSEAIVCYARAGVLDPSDYRWPYSRGVRQRVGDQEAAVDSFACAVELEPDYAPIHAYRGDGLLKLGRIDEAERSFARVVALDATIPHGQIGLAKVASARDRSSDALQRLQDVISRSPRCGEAHQLLATVHRRLGNSAESIAHAQKAACYPGPPKLEDPVRDKLYWEEGVTLRWRRARTSQHLSRGRPRDALAEWQSAARDDPRSVEVQLELALAHARLGEAGPALAACERARLLDGADGPNPRVTLRHGQVLARLGRSELAVEEFRRALDANPELHEARSNLGAILLDTGMVDEGLEQLERAADAQQNDVDVQFVSGLAFAEAGRLKPAARYLRRVLDADPYHVRARFEYAVVLARSGQSAAAATEFAVVIAADPSRPSVHVNFGKALRESGRDADALAAFRAGLEHVPGHPVLLRSVSWLLSTSQIDVLRNGNEARRLARELCEASGYANPAELQTLAAACAESGDYDGAVIHASDALSRVMSQPEDRARIERHLARYRARKPLRE